MRGEESERDGERERERQRDRERERDMVFVAGQFKGWLAWKEGNGHDILRLNNKSWQESNHSGPLSQESRERGPEGEGSASHTLSWSASPWLRRQSGIPWSRAAWNGQA